jgi:hypothetical protein
MLDFCAPQDIEALTAPYPLCQVNEATAPLEADKANYRVVVENDAVLPCAGATWTQPGWVRPQAQVHSDAR